MILAGHDFGGTCISYAMELFPRKVSKAVFIAATMLTSEQSTLDMLSQKVGLHITLELFNFNKIFILAENIMEFGIWTCFALLESIGFQNVPNLVFLVKFLELLPKTSGVQQFCTLFTPASSLRSAVLLEFFNQKKSSFFTRCQTKLI